MEQAFRLIIRASTAAELRERILDAAKAYGFEEKNEQLSLQPTRPLIEEVIKCEAPPVNIAPTIENTASEMITKNPPEAEESFAPGELDVRGFPHDPRIHTVKPTKLRDGTWRYGRGAHITDELIQSVEKELSAKMKSAPQVQVASPFGNFTSQAVAAPVEAPPQLPVEWNAPPPKPPVVSEPVATSYAPPTPISATRAAYDFNSFRTNLLMLINDLMNSGKLKKEYLKQLCDYFKVEHIYDIIPQEDKCRELFEGWASQGLFTRV